MKEATNRLRNKQSDGMMVFVLETVALSALDTSNESAQNLKLSRSKKWFVRLPLSGLPREVSETHDGQTRDEGAENKNNKLGRVRLARHECRILLRSMWLFVIAAK